MRVALEADAISDRVEREARQSQGRGKDENVHPIMRDLGAWTVDFS